METPPESRLVNQVVTPVQVRTQDGVAGAKGED